MKNPNTDIRLRICGAYHAADIRCSHCYHAAERMTAQVRAEHRAAEWHRYPPIAVQAALDPVQHYHAVVLAAAHRASWQAPLYGAVDTDTTPPASTPPTRGAFAAMVLAALHRLRRWYAYADTAPSGAGTATPRSIAADRWT